MIKNLYTYFNVFDSVFYDDNWNILRKFEELSKIEILKYLFILSFIFIWIIFYFFLLKYLSLIWFLFSLVVFYLSLFLISFLINKNKVFLLVHSTFWNIIVKAISIFLIFFFWSFCWFLLTIQILIPVLIWSQVYSFFATLKVVSYCWKWLFSSIVLFFSPFIISIFFYLIFFTNFL